MGSKSIFIIIVLLLVVALLILFFYGNFSNDLAKDFEKCSSGDDYCFQKLVSLGYGDESFCDQINALNVRNFCFTYVARNKQDSHICEGIELYEDSNDLPVLVKRYCKAISENKPEQCGGLLHPESVSDLLINNCFYYLGVFNNDLSLCNSINGFKLDDCYADIAYLSNDKSICDFLSNEIDGGIADPSRVRCQKRFDSIKSGEQSLWIDNL